MREQLRQLRAKLTVWRARLLDPPPGAYPAPRPDELILCLICIGGGVPTLLGRAPSSIDALLWPPFVYVWATALVTLPVVIIWTSLARWRGLSGGRLINSALAFRFASRSLALACLAYVVSVISFGGWSAGVAAGFALGFALARFWRAYEMSRWLAQHLVSP